MNKKFNVILFGLIAAILLVACGPAAATPGPVSITITLENNVCTYAGPQPIPVGDQIDADWVVKDSDHSIYTVAAFTLETGKTLDDARAGFIGSGASVGVIVAQGAAEVAPGGGSKVFQIRTTSSPLYLACFTDPVSESIQFLGPFELEGTSQ